MSQEGPAGLPGADIHTVLFDMDGVITSEACYWDAARLTVLEVLGRPEYAAWPAVEFDPAIPLDALLARSRRLLPDETIAQIKARAINTNWDVAYVMAGLYLVHLSAQLDPGDRERLYSLLEKRDWDIPSLHFLGGCLPPGSEVRDGPEIWSAFAVFLGDKQGFEALEALNAYTSERIGLRSSPFRRGGGFWRFCQDLFQTWYLGADLYPQTYQRSVRDFGREGLIYRERPLLPTEQVRETLASLQQEGRTLGIATGRPYLEIVTPLEQMDLLSFFASDRIATHREVEIAEAELKAAGVEAQLSKPHPFLFLRALYPSLSVPDIWEGNYSSQDHQGVAVVGDAVSDIVAAKAIDCNAIAVLTGAGGAAQTEVLRKAGADQILPDITCLKL